MRIEEIARSGAQIYSLHGKIMGGDACTLLRGKVAEALDSGARKLVIDLKHVDWMSSPGISMMMSISRDIAKAGGRLKVANITSIEKVLVITRLTTQFEIHDSIDEAVNSFSG